MKKLRIGIVGCGTIFPMHAVSTAAMEDAQLVCVCDIRKDRAEAAAKKYNAKAYTDYQDMLAAEDLDVLHVCLPHYLHAAVSRYALEHGVHVLCEKPLSIHWADATDNVAFAEKSGLQYGVIFQCRYNPASRFVKQHIEEGSLGEVLSARSTLTWCKPDGYYADSDWKGTWEKEGGGVIINQAIHSLDLVNWFIDSAPLSVFAHLDNRNHGGIEVEDSAEGLIRYENGATYGFWAMNNYGTDEPIEIRLFCENGKAVLSFDDAVITLNDGTVLTTTQAETESLPYETNKEYWGIQHARQIRQFYDSVLGKEPLDISAREALKIQKIVCAIYESGKTGAPILL